ncbi:energy-coupling factor ABC transporter permease [Sinanaerobacter chloroacetimidivorans]|uniref:Energy-coupling factor ABC transporter permease n=1 Tax=Sinanaerobacter chloroacetimidivorans TaxID=2818044 RepID=A0A8J8B0J6_9FIRM|nr:energy-coupling factor ABC transporter permease [Sinanaerobacter chloroacetimidivorans]MBR0596857.1 energy-coupling factor ABC transporter permease [Sinanaerobacter chloroacetimidivorans]
MHMADALITPAVGGVMLAVSAGTIGYSVKKVKEDLDEKKVPLMGVMGAFVFAGQMINFTIPATGSSGHIGGGILLAALLGPYAAFLVLSAVLLIQALFFADGGLLALGCNIINMGFFACFVAYPLLYKPIVKKSFTPKRITLGAISAVIVGLQLGAFSVVLETLISGVTELPFLSFLMLMQPIHLAIGLVEGIATAAVLCFIYQANPVLLDGEADMERSGTMTGKKVLAVLIAVTVFIGGVLSSFASAYPDGLEWSMEGVAGTAELERGGSAYHAAADIQGRTAFLPDYGFKNSDESSALAGTAASGILGGAITLGAAGLAGYFITRSKKKVKCQN